MKQGPVHVQLMVCTALAIASIFVCNVAWPGFLGNDAQVATTTTPAHGVASSYFHCKFECASLMIPKNPVTPGPNPAPCAVAPNPAAWHGAPNGRSGGCTASSPLERGTCWQGLDLHTNVIVRIPRPELTAPSAVFAVVTDAAILAAATLTQLLFKPDIAQWCMVRNACIGVVAAIILYCVVVATVMAVATVMRTIQIKPILANLTSNITHFVTGQWEHFNLKTQVLPSVAAYMLARFGPVRLAHTFRALGAHSVQVSSRLNRLVLGAVVVMLAFNMPLMASASPTAGTSTADASGLLQLTFPFASAIAGLAQRQWAGPDGTPTAVEMLLCCHDPALQLDRCKKAVALVDGNDFVAVFTKPKPAPSVKAEKEQAEEVLARTPNSNRCGSLPVGVKYVLTEACIPNRPLDTSCNILGECDTVRFFTPLELIGEAALRHNPSLRDSVASGEWNDDVKEALCAGISAQYGNLTSLLQVSFARIPLGAVTKYLAYWEAGFGVSTAPGPGPDDWETNDNISIITITTKSTSSISRQMPSLKIIAQVLSTPMNKVPLQLSTDMLYGPSGSSARFSAIKPAGEPVAKRKKSTTNSISISAYPWVDCLTGLRRPPSVQWLSAAVMTMNGPQWLEQGFPVAFRRFQSELKATVGNGMNATRDWWTVGQPDGLITEALAIVQAANSVNIATPNASLLLAMTRLARAKPFVFHEHVAELQELAAVQRLKRYDPPSEQEKAWLQGLAAPPSQKPTPDTVSAPEEPPAKRPKLQLRFKLRFPGHQLGFHGPIRQAPAATQQSAEDPALLTPSSSDTHQDPPSSQPLLHPTDVHSFGLEQVSPQQPLVNRSASSPDPVSTASGLASPSTQQPIGIAHSRNSQDAPAQRTSRWSSASDAKAWVQSQLEVFGAVHMLNKLTSLEKKLGMAATVQQLQSCASNASKACGRLSGKAAEHFLQHPKGASTNIRGSEKASLQRLRDQGLSWWQKMIQGERVIYQTDEKWGKMYCDTRDDFVRQLQDFARQSTVTGAVPREFEQHRGDLQQLMESRGREFIDCELAVFTFRLEGKLKALYASPRTG